MQLLANLTGCEPPFILEKFSILYSEAHKYLALALCAFGAATNLVNMVVLCQKSMRNPTNTLLTALSVSDGLMSSVYLPFCVYFLMGDRLKLLCPEPYPWQLFLWIQLCVVILVHALSSWITVALAVFRLVYIKLPVRSKQLCTELAARVVVLMAFLASSCMVLPNFFDHKISAVALEDVQEKLTDCALDLNRTYYRFKMRNDNVISSVNFWVMGVGIKTLPVLLLAVLSVFLVHSLKETARRRQTLKANSGALARTGSGRHQHGGCAEDCQSNRTTKLLIVIVLVSVFSILPQGALILVLGSQPTQDAKNCITLKYYDPLGDVFDLMTLLNHSINFVVYYSMSKQFRGCFTRLLLSLASKCCRAASSAGEDPLIPPPHQPQQQLRPKPHDSAREVAKETTFRVHVAGGIAEGNLIVEHEDSDDQVDEAGETSRMLADHERSDSLTRRADERQVVDEESEL